MRPRFSRLTAALAAAVVLAAPAAWAQEDGGEGSERGAPPLDFLVRPAPDASTPPRGGYFLLDLEPDAETRQSLTVHNRGDEALELSLAAVDADTGPIGGASYRRLDAPVEATGAWIALGQDRVRLGPGETTTIDFTVTVPADADSGDHLAGIAVWAPDDVEEIEETSGAVIAVEQRRIVAVHVALPGPAEPTLRISGVEPQARPGGVRLLVHIANEGRGLTAGEGVLEVVEPTFQHAFEFGTFVPRTAIAYPVRWVEGRPAEGTYHARVRLEYGMSTETWEGTFTIGEEITREVDRLDPEGAGPWLWLLVGAAASLALTAAGLVFHRLRQR